MFADVSGAVTSQTAYGSVGSLHLTGSCSLVPPGRSHYMLIVNIRTDNLLLQEALSHAPGMAVSHEELYQTPDGLVFQFWAEGGDFRDFEEGLIHDPTVTDVTQLVNTAVRRLYRVSVREDEESMTTFQIWPELNISLLDLTGTQEGWELHVRIPDREALFQFYEECEKRHIQYRLDAIYEEGDAKTQAEAQLTNNQREVLLTAPECGYYQIPRQASLAEVADRCGISSQAASERLRRGTRTLIDATL